MALLYDHFGVRRFSFRAHMWPEMEDFASAELRQLFGELSLGADDEFESCEILPSGAVFEGEHWVYELNLSSVRLQCFGYSSLTNLRASVRGLLEQTREFFKSSHVIFYVTSMNVYGTVPDDKDRHVGEVVMRKLLRNVKQEDRDILDGLEGAGLSLVGTTDEDLHWHARIEPPHGAYEVLGLAAELMFPPSPEPPKAGEDLDRIDDQIEATHDFITTRIPQFANRLFT